MRVVLLPGKDPASDHLQLDNKSYPAGYELELPDARAAELVAKGHAAQAPAAEAPKKAK